MKCILAYKLGKEKTVNISSIEDDIWAVSIFPSSSPLVLGLWSLSQKFVLCICMKDQCYSIEIFSTFHISMFHWSFLRKHTIKRISKVSTRRYPSIWDMTRLVNTNLRSENRRRLCKYIALCKYKWTDCVCGSYVVTGVFWGQVFMAHVYPNLCHF